MTASNAFGRQVVVPLVNKSGGSVAAGDLVYLNDGATADSFTTGTTSAYTGGVGIAQETIASNGTGRVLVGGYASLVNVNASVTIGHYGKGYTVAKQATDAGASRVQGAFCQFQTGGATPTAIIWQPDLGSGSGLAHSTLGYNTAGGSFATTRSGYYTQITIPASGGFLTAISAYVKGDGTNNHGVFPVIFDDNGSNVPRNLLYIPGAAVTATPTRNEQTRFNTTARWLSFGVGTYFTGSTKLWIGIWMNANADSTIQLAFDATSGTSYIQSGVGFNWPTDNSIDSAHFSSSTNKYSIYADILS